VEVKTGEQAIDPLDPRTRRQLLEYSLALRLHGLFLLDMETPRLMRIRFPGVASRGARIWPWVLVCGFALGVAATVLLGDSALGR
jgi:hypothetical protein